MSRLRRSFVALATICAAASLFAAVEEQPSLKALVPKGLLIGSALNQAQSDGTDTVSVGIVTRHFNTITPENIFKWQIIHPELNRYAFDAQDRFVAFGQQHGMFIVGHTLVWHQQIPGWVFKTDDGSPIGREALLDRMRSHIETVVGRYRGRIYAWDVVNEALNEDGTLRKSPWFETLGDEFIYKAFEFAHKADPAAQLYYNDYNLTVAAKRAGALRIVKELKARGLRIDGVGEQGHWLLSRPSLADIEATVAEIGAAAGKCHITELDVDVLPRDDGMYGADLNARAKYKAETNLYADGLPAEKQRELAQRYSDIFKVFLKHRSVLARVTFWGVSDRSSWLDNFPVPGRVNHPLLWDRAGKPKPAFDAVVQVLRESQKEQSE